MKSAHFTYIGKGRNLRGKVTLKDDGKISVSLFDGRMASSASRYQAKMYAEKIVKDNFTDPTITDIEEIITDSPLIQILHHETESLKIQYVEKVTNYAAKQFKDAFELTHLNAPDLHTKFGVPFTFENGKMIFPKDVHGKYMKELKTIFKELNNARQIVRQTEKVFINKAIKRAEQHYYDSIIKLARRIESKGLDVSKLKAETSHISVNINTTLTDGNLSVRAWTIIAEGPIQQPHYRYLIK